MKNITYITSIILTIFSTISYGQNSLKTLSISYYAGVQNPNETEFISFGRGPRERFGPGTIAGVKIERGFKRFSISSQLNYMNNTLTRSEIQSKKALHLHTIHPKSSINLNALNPNFPLKIKVGLGAGLPISYVPAMTLQFDQEEFTGYPSEYHAPSEVVLSLSLHSRASLEYSINDKFDIYLGYERDLVLYYGNMEDAIIHSGRLGISRKIGR